MDFFDGYFLDPSVSYLAVFIVFCCRLMKFRRFVYLEPSQPPMVRRLPLL